MSSVTWEDHRCRTSDTVHPLDPQDSIEAENDGFEKVFYITFFKKASFAFQNVAPKSPKKN